MYYRTITHTLIKSTLSIAVFMLLFYGTTWGQTKLYKEYEREVSALSLFYSIATTSVIKAQIAPHFLHASSFCYTHSALYMFYAWRKSHKILVPEWTFFHNWVLSCFPVCKFPFPWKIYKNQQDYPLTFRWVLIFISF